MSTKSHLNHCIAAFAGELVSFVQRAQDSINSLKRTAEQRPQAGVQDFKECLDDLEQQVADFTDEIQQLVGCTSDTTSFEELIGHCTAVYSTTRANAIALEQHLAQYGYQQAPGTQTEPQNPDTLVDEQGYEGLPYASTSSRSALTSLPSTGQQRLSQSTPGSPVSKSSFGSSTYAPSRLGISQPSSPLGAHRTPAAAAAAAGLWAAHGVHDFRSLGTMRTGGVAAAENPFTGLHDRAAAPEAFTQLKQDRKSLGAVSNTSSTPAGLLISPGVAALANKYATSSVGGSSVGALNVPDQPSAGPPSSDKRSPCRDLSLSYNLTDMNSPDLPIFGMTPATIGSRVQQQPMQSHQTANPQQHAAAGTQATPVAAAGKGGIGSEEDSTGELYSSLIHSNLTGVARASKEDSMQRDREPVTPPCAPNSCPSSPQAPATAGRLPAEWHSKKMQELENLQADLTITLSQMKRTPSRSRLTALANSDRDDDEDADQWQGQQQQLPQAEPLQQVQDQQQQQQQELRHMKPGLRRNLLSHQQPAEAANAADVAVVHHSAAVVSVPDNDRPQLLQCNKPAGQAAADAGASKPVVLAGKAAAATAAVSAATAAGAAVSADLESLMASLSMKYAPSDISASSNGSKEASTVGNSIASSDAGTARNTPTPDQHLSAGATPTCSPEPVSNELSADETSLIMKYTAAPAAGPTSTAAAAESAQGSQLLPAPPSCPTDKHSRLAARAAAAEEGLANLSVASTETVGAGMGRSVTSSSGATPGKVRLAANLAAGMEAWKSAVHMDCPSPLSPASPAGDTPAEQAAAATAAAAAEYSAGHGTGDHTCSPVVAVTPEVAAHHSPGADVGGSSLLTPATQLAIKYAVEAAGLNTAANRPKSSIRRMQPTTDLSRLEVMRGQLQTQHRGVADSFELEHQQQQPQQQGQESLAENLESRLAGAAEGQEENGSDSSRSANLAQRAVQQVGQKQQQQPDMLLSLRKQRQHTAVAELQKQVQQAQREQEKLTPRAARLQRRQQMQQDQEQQEPPARQQSRRAGTGVLRSVENTSHGQDSNSTPKGKTAAAAAQGSNDGSAKKGGSSSGRNDAGPAVLVKVKPVSVDEFAGLPGWCRGLLNVEVLNAAMDELNEMMAGRAGKRSCSSNEGFTAADLELLGHSSSKSKTIVSCLHKLSRATLQRSAAGSNIYKLVGTAT